jgi:hypothetical protein
LQLAGLGFPQSNCSQVTFTSDDLEECKKRLTNQRRTAMSWLTDRQRIDLDNYITGHWGEDQFKNEPPENTDFDTLEEQTREDDEPTGELFQGPLDAEIDSVTEAVDRILGKDRR